jgi:hypothetical protein
VGVLTAKKYNRKPRFMAMDTKRGRQTKWGADISVNLLRQTYDPILVEPIPAKLIKAASVLADVAINRLEDAQAMHSDAD